MPLNPLPPNPRPRKWTDAQWEVWYRDGEAKQKAYHAKRRRRGRALGLIGYDKPPPGEIDIEVVEG